MDLKNLEIYLALALMQIDKLVDGQRVSFDIEKNNGKATAVNIKSEE